LGFNTHEVTGLFLVAVLVVRGMNPGATMDASGKIKICCPCRKSNHGTSVFRSVP